MVKSKPARRPVMRAVSFEDVGGAIGRLTERAAAGL